MFTSSVTVSNNGVHEPLPTRPVHFADDGSISFFGCRIEDRQVCRLTYST